MPDERDPERVVHPRREQVLQRVVQIALGYADQNDADRLRNDPVLKAVCDGLPDEGDLSAQATLSRFENAVDADHVESMQWMLVMSWLRNLDPKRREIIIDVDSSAFEGHGQQEELFFNGFYDAHILFPLLIFDGETGQLITVILRPGNVHDLSGTQGWIERLVTLIKVLHRRNCSVVVRADAGFASPAIYAALEELDQCFGQVGYLIGLAKNAVLLRRIEPALVRARELRDERGQASRVLVDFEYQAGSWPHPRHVVGKAEVTMLGDNPRFVVTNLSEFEPRLLYETAYCGRGRCEQWIGEFKGGLEGDRISCHRFEANAFRLILHAAAYRLLFELRRTIAEHANTDNPIASRLRHLARASFATLRLRLLKVAVIVRQSARRLFLQGARSFPMADVFHHVARAMT